MRLSNIQLRVAIPVKFPSLTFGKLQEFNIDASKLYTSHVGFDIDGDFCLFGACFMGQMIETLVKGAEFFAKGVIVNKVEGEIIKKVNSEVAGKNLMKLISG